MAPKRGAKAPVPARKKAAAAAVNPLFEKRPKQFGIGGALPPRKDLHRFVRWPKAVRIQRQRRVLKQRLKVPPALNQFTRTLDKNLATNLFKMLLKYHPEDKAAKKERLLKRAQAEAEGKTVEAKKPIVVKYGLDHVTYLIEQSKAQLVVIAHDVDPIELVVWLPALCRKMEIPYCIVKGKARLGSIVHKKTASVLCLTTVKNEDKLEFSKILEAIKSNFNDKFDEVRKKWGGGIMGSKSQAKTKAREKLLAKEAAPSVRDAAAAAAAAHPSPPPHIAPPSSRILRRAPPLPPRSPPLPVPQARADRSSNLNNSASNLQDSSGRPFTASFSGQSGSVPGAFHHSGLHNIHANFNLPNMPGSLAQRNAAMSGLPSSGVQQPGGSISARFASNNLPVGMSQLPHGHSGVSSRVNVGGGPAFSSSLNIGGTIQGLSSNLGAGGNRNSVPGMSVSPALGNLGPRITGSVGNIVGGSNIGRNISSGGLSVPSIASRMNLSGNIGSGGLNVQGSSRMMNGILQQGSPQMMNMMGSSYPTSGGSLSQNQIQGGNNSLGSMGMLHDANDSAPYDMNDFPQLTGRPSSAGGPQGQYGSLRKQGVGVNTIVQQNQEFSIQNEDFPALPGYKGSTSDYAMELHHKEQLHDNVPVMQAQQYPMSRSVGFNLGSNYPPNRQQHQQGANSVQNAGPQNIGLRSSASQTSSLGSYEQLIQQYQQPQTQNPFRLQQVSSATQSYRDQSLKSIQGGQTPPDPYGLMGLLGVIRMNDADLASLALGMDLTTLGLNLNSPDNLYKTFGSPWSNEPAKGEPEFHIPACYNAEQPPPLQPIHFQKFQTLTLFYIFYSMPRDEAQLCAASELYNRGWFYHKEVRVWLTRIPNVEPLVKTPHYERGSYGCFDPNNWETIRKDNFVLHYDQIEKKPAIPSSSQTVRGNIS